MKEGLHSADTTTEERYEKKCQTKPGQLGIGCQTNGQTLTFWKRGMVFVKCDLKAKLYRKKCSMPAFLRNSCCRAGKTNKTLANVLGLYSALALGGFGQFQICSNCGCGLRAPCAKRKIKKRELTFKHISDAS